MLRRAFTSPSKSLSRTFATSRPASSAWSPGPAPPRLPKEDQEIFEQLQRESTGAFSTPRTPPKVNQSPDAAAEQSAAQSQADTSVNSAQVEKGEELHPNVRRGAAPEFEGTVNPETGEANGPKNNPLRWGGESDWSFNGRVTDF